MPRAVSIHVGVNTPHGPLGNRPLQYGETNAWRMAELASQAGYESLLVLRGQAATRPAVHAALTGAAGSLTAGDTLFVSFSGHGSQHPDTNEDRDERCGIDQGWCLADGILLDDKLAGYWRLFEPAVRIVLVVESCYAAGMRREDEKRARPVVPPTPRRVYRGGGTHRGADDGGVAVADYAASCIVEPPRDADGIRASVLMLSASREEQPSSDGLFARHLLALWDEGSYRGSYCELYWRVRDRVMAECGQEPQIHMLGTSDPAFPLATAFHLERPRARRSAATR